MTEYTTIINAVKALLDKYHVRDVFELCACLGIGIIPRDMGSEEDAIKGFVFGACRCKRIVVNCNIPEFVLRIIIAHEIGHAILNPESAFQQYSVISLEGSSEKEKTANLFAAELLLEDEEVIQTLKETKDFFRTAALLNVPAEILCYKFNLMDEKGYNMPEVPMYARSTFMKNMYIPPKYDDWEI